MNINGAKRRAATLAVSAVAIGGFALGTASPAAAWTEYNGNLESMEFGLYYNSGNGGCVFDLGASLGEFAGHTFVGNCSGSGQKTNDNTASYWNRAGYTWHVWTDHYQEGTRGSLPAGYSGNASDTFKNKVSSASWIIF
ncbi:hypothetical protein [Streptomyces sp. NPDC051000]|uniref:hypothetical protein n=1 Tax=Streptomyces sp. NPDC051000 TaxID=3155520 RepID=UPI00340EBC90